MTSPDAPNAGWVPTHHGHPQLSMGKINHFASHLCAKTFKSSTARTTSDIRKTSLPVGTRLRGDYHLVRLEPAQWDHPQTSPSSKRRLLTHDPGPCL